MKYEEIKIGDVFGYGGDEETVISKNNKYRIITTIDTDMTPSTFKEEELHYLKPIKEELPEEGLLVYRGDGTTIYRTVEITGYGFENGKYTIGNNWTFVMSPHEWRKATEDEENKFIEILKKECEKHGLFKDTKIEKHADGNDSFLNTNSFEPYADTTEICNRNGQIFYKGKFATPLKETTTTPQVGRQYKHKKGNIYTVVGFTNEDTDREDKDFPVTVLYIDQEGRNWSRPLSEWDKSFILIKIK